MIGKLKISNCSIMKVKTYLVIKANDCIIIIQYIM